MIGACAFGAIEPDQRALEIPQVVANLRRGKQECRCITSRRDRALNEWPRGIRITRGAMCTRECAEYDCVVGCAGEHVFQTRDGFARCSGIKQCHAQ